MVMSLLHQTNYGTSIKFSQSEKSAGDWILLTQHFPRWESHVFPDLARLYGNRISTEEVLGRSRSPRGSLNQSTIRFYSTNALTIFHEIESFSGRLEVSIHSNLQQVNKPKLVGALGWKSREKKPASRRMVNIHG